LLNARRRELARCDFDPGADAYRLPAAIDGTPLSAHHAKNSLCSSGIGPARMRVADIGREEFEETRRRALAGSCNQRRERGSRGDGNELAHQEVYPPTLPHPHSYRHRLLDNGIITYRMALGSRTARPKLGLSWRRRAPRLTTASTGPAPLGYRRAGFCTSAAPETNLLCHLAIIG
jgi:hypothetical protein